MNELIKSAELEASRLKQFFPFRICWFAIHPETLDKQIGANKTKAPINRLLKQGYKVWVV